ncbi:hypothetical protein TNIN_138561 [Trichonephila inaurata madagascariensis]|uniref:Uncharacterized protein n=1 Tax=Trichonephila inaurata madagascariensis TaxID=2747483 RepID=A0A8X6WYU1_9ARAC|nr:hypothetical protein TNIN_138561 [Trichonephila inaurata madagascariensis]
MNQLPQFPIHLVITKPRFKTLFFQRCFHHGCEICYYWDLIHLLAATTMKSLRQKKEGVIDMLTQRGYNNIQMLEQVFVNLKKTRQFKEFLKQYEATDPLNLR